MLCWVNLLNYNMYKCSGFYLGIILYIIYYLQGILYPTGNIVSQMAIFTYVIIGGYYFLKVLLLNNNPAIIVIWSLFFIIQVLSFIAAPFQISGEIGMVSTLLQFKGIAAFSLTLFLAYFVAFRCEMSDRELAIIGIIFFILSVMRFYYDQYQLFLHFDKEGVTNNSAYMIISTFTFFPIILNRYRIIAIIILFISITLVISGLKRGAIICLIVSFVFLLWYYKKYIKMKLKNCIIVIALIAGVVFYSFSVYESNRFIQKRIEMTFDGDTSGREKMYNFFWEYWNNDTWCGYICGNGMSQTVNIGGNYAHNDWLELLINNGLIGASIYLLFFLLLFRYVIKMNISMHLKCAACLCSLVWFLKTLLSMGYTDLYNIIFVLLLGLLIGKQQRKIMYEKEKNFVFN